MASSFSGTFLTTFQGTYNNSNAISTPSDSPTLSQKTSYANGGAANQASKLAYGQLVFTGGQTQTIDLSSLTDPLGIGFSLVSVGVKGFFFYNLTTTTGSYFTFTPSGTNGWIVTSSGSTYGPFDSSTRKVLIGAGGRWCDESPVDSFAVPDNTHCRIDIFAALAATLNYAIWG